MSLNSHPASDAESLFALMETTDGDVIIFDRDEPSAWLQSDTTLEIAE